MINPISFKANYIKPSTIKCSSTNKDITTSFVELDPLFYADRRAVTAVDYAWSNTETFAHHILCEMEGCLWNTGAQRFFALTTQKRSFDKLIPNKILGLAEIIGGNLEQIKIKFLQVDPETNMQANNHKYTGVGRAILDAIKAIFPNQNIILESVNSERIIEFYERNGFQRIRKGGTNMIFRR